LSITGETPGSRESKLSSIDLWIAEAREDAEEAYRQCYNAAPPNMADKARTYVELYQDLEILKKEMPEAAPSMKVRYVDYRGFYEKGIFGGSIVGQIDERLRRQGGDTIKYHRHAWEMLGLDKITHIYRNPKKPAQLLSVKDYLEQRIASIDDDSGVGVMLVQMSEVLGIEELVEKTPDDMTGGGGSRLVIANSEREVAIDELGIIEWLALISQPVQKEASDDLGGNDETNNKGALPKLGPSWLLANRLPNNGGLYSKHVPFATYDYQTGRNTLTTLPPTTIQPNYSALRPAVVR
jgi:hypothetical protein